MEIVVGILSAVAGLFLYQALNKAKTDKEQVKLEVKTALLEEKANNALAGLKEKEKETQEKVDEITKEQDKPVDNSELVDFFDKRK